MRKSYKNYLKPSSILKFSSLNYLQSFLSFGASILLARTIGKELYGNYALGLIFFNILSTINQFGSEKTLVRDLVQNDEPKSVLKAATYINLAVSVLTLSGVGIWLFFQNMASENTAIVALFAIAGTCLGLSPIAWFDYQGRIHRQALLFALEKLLFFSAVCFILFVGKSGDLALQAAAAFFLCRLTIAVPEWLFVFRNFSGTSKKTNFYIKKLLFNNFWIWLAVIGNLLMTQANQLILRSASDTSQLASYAIAFQLIMLVRLLQRQLMRLMAPSIAELTNTVLENAKYVRKKMHRYYSLAAAVTIVLILPLFVLAPFLITTVAGNQYTDSIPIFQVLLVWISLFGVGLINNQFLIGFGLNRSYLLVTMTFGLLSLGLAFILIPKFGGVGAAMSLLLSHFGSIITQIAVVERFIQKSIRGNISIFT